MRGKEIDDFHYKLRPTLKALVIVHLAYPPYTNSKRKIQLALPNTPYGVLARKKQLLLIRIAIVLFIIIFVVVQLNVINYGESF